MKILYISSGSPDYQSDMIFHGLRNLFGSNVIDYPKIEYMYNNFFEEEIVTTYGKGFTIYRTLEDIKVDRTDIFKKIRDKFFDLIIWSSAHRNKSYFYSALESENKCITIDGEDHTNIDNDMFWRFSYFKRELIHTHKNLKPIQFCFPEEKITPKIQKIKPLATVIPGIKETYIFNKENDYYNDYNQSLFAFTWKKGGWDCLRHYEIIFNNCVPLFLNIKDCPEKTLSFLNKKILIEALNIRGLKIDYNNKQITITDNFDLNHYENILNELKENSLKYLTTKNMAKYLISNI
jgi:hypothetical protein